MGRTLQQNAGVLVVFERTMFGKETKQNTNEKEETTREEESEQTANNLNWFKFKLASRHSYLA